MCSLGTFGFTNLAKSRAAYMRSKDCYERKKDFDKMHGGSDRFYIDCIYPCSG